ncbi:MAG: flagellar basal body P-ring formation protein FlgA [Deltaproteobacteria bacterium]|nr:flagellar basal body P-ring formation protein FlgA [Deltaproteobacteria bacterium]
MIALWIVLTLAAPPGQHRLERDVEASLAAAARERLALGDDATVEVTALRLADPDLLKGRRTVAAVELPPGEQGHGRVTARVTVRDDGRGKAEHDTWATARVDVRVRAVVARHRVDRGALITDADVTTALVPLADAGVAEAALAVGRVARYPIGEGQPLRADALELPTLISRGDHVQAVISGATFAVRAPGEALSRGALGDTVTVRVARTNKIVTGVVTGPGTVEVAR